MSLEDKPEEPDAACQPDVQGQPNSVPELELDHGALADRLAGRRQRIEAANRPVLLRGDMRVLGPAADTDGQQYGGTLSLARRLSGTARP